MSHGLGSMLVHDPGSCLTVDKRFWAGVKVSSE